MAKLNINKAVNKKLDKMLNHFETYNFIKIISNNAIQLNFISENIKEFLRREWLTTNLIASDQPSFLLNSPKSINSTESINTGFDCIKNFTGIVPFSIVRIENDHSEETESSQPKNSVQLLSNQFRMKNGTLLRNQMFSSSSGEEEFYKMQRSRKIWWKKFAAYPGRFSISNTNTKVGEKSIVSTIQAEFPWGIEDVETVTYSQDFGGDDQQTSEMQVKVSKRKKIKPQVITCETVLENMVLTYLCDSFESCKEESGKNLLRLDRKLAPYKVSIAGTGETPETVKNLEDLSLLLAKQIRKLGLPVLFLHDACTTNVKKQLVRNDALGIPYTLLLNDNTLKDGLISIRSRDTTLEEQSHVSIVVEYLEKLFK